MARPRLEPGEIGAIQIRTLASRLLGHANEQVTRSNYVVTAEMVDPVTADIMDDAFTSFSALSEIGGLP